MFVHGEWAIEKGGVPASFGRYGAQRHHFETAHSIRVAPTDFHTEVALSAAHSIRVAPTGIESGISILKLLSQQRIRFG